MTIAIPDRGRITVEPAIKDRDELLDQHRDAKAKLKDALQTGGIKTVNDAEVHYTRRQKLLQTAELARQEAELHAPATDDHAAGAQALSDHIEGLRKILAREMAELDAMQCVTQWLRNGGLSMEKLSPGGAGLNAFMPRGLKRVRFGNLCFGISVLRSG